MEFRNKFKSKRLTSIPSSLGISPVNRFKGKFRIERAVSLPNTEGIVPVKSLNSRSSSAEGKRV
jgi:hypothetical protein